jgi:hypothetical protein
VAFEKAARAMLDVLFREMEIALGREPNTVEVGALLLGMAVGVLHDGKVSAKWIQDQVAKLYDRAQKD